MLKRLFLLLALLALPLTFAAAQDATPEATPETTNANAQTPAELCAAATPVQPATREFERAEQVLEPGVDYRAIMCTEAGAVYIDLFEDYTPITVNNFVFLAQQGYYDNTTFHRVIADFMAQGGDPTATGMGGPGYQFQDEFVGFLTFDRPGWLAMANAGAGTNGSQFFITTVETPHLDFRHTIFGEVLEGQENVAALRLRDPQADTTPGAALNTVLIITDPSTVNSTYAAPAAPTAEEVIASFETLSGQIPPEYALDYTVSESLDADALAAVQPEASREGFAAWLNDHNFQYAVTSQLNNATCNMQLNAFMTYSYNLYNFGTAEDARAALTDGYLGEFYNANGYTAIDSPDLLRVPLYRTQRDACNESATVLTAFLPRGAFLAEIEIVLPSGMVEGREDDVISQILAGLFEIVNDDILRRSLR
jgi:cyclophilin family peptidyl-prolyl cis-trans isomerase